MFLDPGKLLVIGAVALMVLGPDRLPKVARTVGSVWHDFTRWRATLDEHVRGAFPDMPAAHDIAAAVRSPIALLDRLAKESVAPADITVAASEMVPPGIGPVAPAWGASGEAVPSSDGGSGITSGARHASEWTDGIWMN